MVGDIFAPLTAMELMPLAAGVALYNSLTLRFGVRILMLKLLGAAGRTVMDTSPDQG